MPIKSIFVSFKFQKKCAKFAQRSFNLAKNGDVITQYRYSDPAFNLISEDSI